jgi:hypothetical protein
MRPVKSAPRLGHEDKKDFANIYCHLDDGGNLSCLDELQNFFTKQQSKWASVVKSPPVDLKAKKVSAVHSKRKVLLTEIFRRAFLA